MQYLQLATVLIVLLFNILGSHEQKIMKNDVNQSESNQTFQETVIISKKLNQQQNKGNEVYGVRWFLGDYFAYSNLFSTQKTNKKSHNLPLNSNYYTISFNSQQKFQQDIYIDILSTTHTCSHRLIQVDFTNDHDPIQLKPNKTNHDSNTNIYRCYINVDLSLFWEEAVMKGIVDDRASVWKQYPYVIYTQQPQFRHSVQQPNDQPNKIKRYIKPTKTILFESRFRAPIPVLPKPSSPDDNTIKIQQNVLVAGDWGIISQQIQQQKKYIPILQSVLTKIQEDSSIVLFLFLGDIAYDLVGEKYKQILLYLQPLLSRICFMVSPGNHDYVYHEDSFELFAETFLSPEWSKYYNFYYTFIVGDVMFVSYSPQIQKQNYRLETNINAIEVMQADFSNNSIHLNPNNYNKSNNAPKNDKDTDINPDNINPISKQYHVVVFTHYPMFCSKGNDDLQTCKKSKYSLKQYLKVFTQIGMDLYFSGHVHYYQRTHALCWDTNKLEQTVKKYQSQEGQYQIYTADCPIYVIQGAAGNDYFVQQQGAVTPTQITSKIAFNTGFGILSIQTKISNRSTSSIDNKTLQSKQNQFVYTHYKMLSKNKTIIIDQFIKKMSVLSKYEFEIKNQNSTIYIDNDVINVRILQILGTVLFIIIGSITCFCYGRFNIGDFRVMMGKKKKVGEHVEMVQDNINSDLSDNKNHSQEKKGGKGEDQSNYRQ